MITKTFEIRDRATFIPVLGVQLNPGCEPDRYLFSRSGFGRSSEDQSQYVCLIKIDGGEGKASSDPYFWKEDSRTMIVAHDHIIKNFTWLNSGDVIDVEFILGETKNTKISERLEEINYGK